MLKRRLRSIMKKVPWLRPWMPAEDRSFALQLELQFWRDWFRTRGLEWPEDYKARFNPDQPIQKHVAAYIDRLENDDVRILDVGAGPLTKLGKKHPGKRLSITATDLLAPEYNKLIDELKVQPLVRSIHADVEKLVEQFGENAFDIVHGQNCIDHTANPMRSIDQMIAVSRPGGFVVLYHAEKEGQREKYQQLHQWDFACEDGCFVIGDRHGRKTNMTQRLAGTCKVECIPVPEDESILTAIRKNS